MDSHVVSSVSDTPPTFGSVARLTVIVPVHNAANLRQRKKLVGRALRALAAKWQ